MTPSMPLNNNNNQNGNIFVLILAGVFLFGALMYTFTRTSETGTGNFSKQEAKIAAQEILNYARLVEGAVDRVRRNGCSENEISFENSVVSGYSNPNAPSDNSCHIFESEGGRIEFATPPPNTTVENYLFSGRNTSSAGSFCTGAQCTDLILFLHDVPVALCTEVNKSLNNGLSSSIPRQHDPHSKALFVGDFSRVEGIEDSAGASLTELENINSACVEESDMSGYFFYHVLLAR